MKEYKLNIKERAKDQIGKNISGRFRKSGMVPANVIATGNSTLIQFVEKDLELLIKAGLRNSSLINLENENGGGGGSKKQVVVKEIQRHPVTNKILHVDFYQVTHGKTLTVNVAVNPVGLAKGIKAGGSLEHLIRKLKIKSKPESLKEVIEVDVTNLELGQAIRFEDLKLPADWIVKMEGNPVIVKIAYARVAAVEEAAKTEATATAGATPTTSATT